MLEDVNGGIAWTLAHAEEHGGDPHRTYLVGQSCGAQLAALALVTQVASLATAQTWPGLCLLLTRCSLYLAHFHMHLRLGSCQRFFRRAGL